MYTTTYPYMAPITTTPWAHISLAITSAPTGSGTVFFSPSVFPTCFAGTALMEKESDSYRIQNYLRRQTYTVYV
jgi:hypothetical protein